MDVLLYGYDAEAPLYGGQVNRLICPNVPRMVVASYHNDLWSYIGGSSLSLCLERVVVCPAFEVMSQTGMLGSEIIKEDDWLMLVSIPPLTE